ncbi:MAG: hypothetical protein JNL67_03335 [Planctomycetaceae bacterium]|nr:hypothetical protein [Planctomycetaceae bacterium]
MPNHRLTQAFPNESFQLVLQFDEVDYRLFAMSILSRDKGWTSLAYPSNLKRFTWDTTEIVWSTGERIDSDFLFEHSTPLDHECLDHQVLRLSYKNQAPTTEHKKHHVFGVYLAPLSTQWLRLSESIGGGVAETGHDQALTLSELFQCHHWQEHFQRAGCSWACKLVENLATQPEQLLQTLVREARERNGMPED